MAAREPQETELSGNIFYLHAREVWVVRKVFMDKYLITMGRFVVHTEWLRDKETDTPY